jgi:hypothetical protein
MANNQPVEHMLGLLGILYTTSTLKIQQNEISQLSYKHKAS